MQLLWYFYTQFLKPLFSLWFLAIFLHFRKCKNDLFSEFCDWIEVLENKSLILEEELVDQCNVKWLLGVELERTRADEFGESQGKVMVDKMVV